MKISIGVAKGVAHTHSANEGQFVHGNINSSNILVTANLQGCISYFGLYSLFGDSLGFLGEMKDTKHQKLLKLEHVLTQKADVYSFGVLLFELLTGKLPLEYYKKGLSFVTFDDASWDAMHDRMPRQMMMLLAKACMGIEPELRPSMDEVVRKMEIIRAVADVPL